MKKQGRKEANRQGNKQAGKQQIKKTSLQPSWKSKVMYQPNQGYSQLTTNSTWSLIGSLDDPNDITII